MARTVSRKYIYSAFTKFVGVMVIYRHVFAIRFRKNARRLRINVNRNLNKYECMANIWLLDSGLIAVQGVCQIHSIYAGFHARSS